MRHTKHFAGVMGAAGIVVGPFMMTAVAQADDTLPPDTSDFAFEGDANVDPPEYREDGVPNLPITRVVSDANSVPSEEYLTPVVSKNPAALAIVQTGEGVVLADLPGELNDSVELSGDVLKNFIVEGSAIGMDGATFEFDGMNWVMVTPVVEEESEAATQPVVKQEVVSQDVADKLNAYVAQRNAGNVVAASNMVGVEAPATDGVAGPTDGVADEVPPAPSAPQLPVTGDDAADVSSTEDSTLPLAPLLGITGLVLGGGIGVITMKKRLSNSE